jgi:hypothetical protein
MRIPWFTVSMPVLGKTMLPYMVVVHSDPPSRPLGSGVAPEMPM